MFYVYRLDGVADHERFLIDADKATQSPDFSPQQFLKVAKQVGWDGTWTGVLYQFALPHRPFPLEGYAMQERAGGRWFLGSPVELAYLTGMIDWDAHTDSQELKRTIAMMEGDQSGVERKVRIDRSWRLNDKGTTVSTIEGCNCCVVPVRYHGAGYLGVIFSRSEPSRKVTTPAFPTIQDAQKHLETRFFQLTAAWRHPNEPDDDDDSDTNIIIRPL